MRAARLLATVYRLTRSLLRNRRGNVLMLMVFSVIPLTLATGISVDYSRAARLQTRMNAAADAAALAAVTQPMMKQDNAVARTAAINMFNAQVSALKGLIYNSADLTVTITGTVGAANVRTAVVTYKAKSTNAFAGIVGLPIIEIGGSSTAHAAAAPNIDFYILLDTSPSMLLPTTTAGLASLKASTNGCAFACHKTDRSTTADLVQYNGVWMDYYEVARAKGIELRTDVLHQAVEDLTDTAFATAAENGARYRMGLSSFDYTHRLVWPKMASGGYYLESTLSTLKNHVADATVLPYCRNNQRVCGTNDSDTATNFTTAFTEMGSKIVNPGDGTNQATDKPQAILFLLTDGMRDESNNGRQLGPIPASLCTTIKNRGIRIAILYTEYLPESASDSWSVTNVKTPYLDPTDKISPALIACASSGLFYKVTTDNDISAALTALFQKAVSTARLTQ
jgi:Flp pilus assembly protein TadG